MRRAAAIATVLVVWSEVNVRRRRRSFERRCEQLIRRTYQRRAA